MTCHPRDSGKCTDAAGHHWKYFDEIYLTYPAQQHRRCEICANKECVPICRPGVACRECTLPYCDCACHKRKKKED